MAVAARHLRGLLRSGAACSYFPTEHTLLGLPRPVEAYFTCHLWNQARYAAQAAGKRKVYKGVQIQDGKPVQATVDVNRESPVAHGVLFEGNKAVFTKLGNARAWTRHIEQIGDRMTVGSGICALQALATFSEAKPTRSLLFQVSRLVRFCSAEESSPRMTSRLISALGSVFLTHEGLRSLLERGAAADAIVQAIKRVTNLQERNTGVPEILGLLRGLSKLHHSHRYVFLIK